MSLRVANPYSGETVCELPFDDGASLGQRVAHAHAAQQTWRTTPLAERVDRIRQGLQVFASTSDEMARDITRQMGKPLTEARREVAVAVERAEHMLAISEEALAPDLLPDLRGITRRIEHEPLGVVLNLAAWNYPLLIAMNVVVPALLAGNAVLLKHSARTPLGGEHFARAFGGVGRRGCVRAPC